MSKRILVSTTLVLASLLCGSAALAQALQLGGNADCDGWSAMATLTYPADVFGAELDYSVVLSDASGAEVTRFDWAGTINRYEELVMIKMYGEPWDLTLDGAYTVSAVFHFLGEEAAMSFDVVCGEVDEGEGGGGEDTEPVIEPCRHTYRYWRKNPDQWPVQELEIAGETYGKDQLLRLMHRHLRLAPAFNLVRPLVAAKLNVAAGSDPVIQPVIDAADTFLAEHRDSRSRRWRHRAELRQLRSRLVAYNNQPCAEAGLGFDGGRPLLDKTYADEPVSFSGLKAMYR